MTRHEEDLLAVRRCLSGEPAAFRELLERYKNPIFGLLLRLVRNPADAEDLAQDTFVKAFKKLASYNPDYPFITWLFRIAHNTAIDFLRAKKPAAVSIYGDEDSEHPEEFIPSAQDEIGAVLEETLIEKLLARLPPLYREALILRHKEGLEVKEIARVLEIPEGTAKIRLFRGRELLKRAMADPNEITDDPMKPKRPQPRNLPGEPE